MISVAHTRIRGRRWFDPPKHLVELVDPVSLLVGCGDTRPKYWLEDHPFLQFQEFDYIHHLLWSGP